MQLLSNGKKVAGKKMTIMTDSRAWSRFLRKHGNMNAHFEQGTRT
jgi:hypothetical protein